MNILGLKIKDTPINYIIVLTVIFIFVYFIFKWLSGVVKNTGNKLEFGEPGISDRNNAEIIRQNMGSFVKWDRPWITNDDKIVPIVLQYKKDTYPLLKSAYFDLTDEDLTSELKDKLSESNYAKIIHIVI